MDHELVAPCGMNCGICSGYLALKNGVRSQGINMAYCKGCRPRNKQCAFLKKKCQLYLDRKIQFCFECPDFPCQRLVRLDKRYQTLFRMSMIDNLNYIERNGIGPFLEREREKWRCPECGDTICCHNGICFKCGLSELKAKKKKYRWEDD